MPIRGRTTFKFRRGVEGQVDSSRWYQPHTPLPSTLTTLVKVTLKLPQRCQMRKSSFSLAAASQASMDSFTLGSVHGHERSGTGPNEDKAPRAFTGHHPRRGDRPRALMPLAGGKRRSPAGPPPEAVAHTHVFGRGARDLNPRLGEEGAGAQHEHYVHDGVDGVFQHGAERLGRRQVIAKAANGIGACWAARGSVLGGFARACECRSPPQPQGKDTSERVGKNSFAQVPTVQASYRKETFM